VRARSRGGPIAIAACLPWPVLRPGRFFYSVHRAPRSGARVAAPRPRCAARPWARSTDTSSSRRPLFYCCQGCALSAGLTALALRRRRFVAACRRGRSIFLKRSASRCSAWPRIGKAAPAGSAPLRMTRLRPPHRWQVRVACVVGRGTATPSCATPRKVFARAFISLSHVRCVSSLHEGVFLHLAYMGAQALRAKRAADCRSPLFFSF
jgi:hypothetical protein